MNRLLFIWLLFLPANLLAVGVQIFLPVIHLADSTIDIGEKYKYKLDAKGRYVLMPGISIFYDPQGKWHHLRLRTAVYRDCLDSLSGTLHLGWRWRFNLSQNFAWSLGLGPTLWFRKSWQRFPFYSGNLYLKEYKGYEWIFFPFGSFEITYLLKPKLQLVWTIVPALPLALIQALGLKYTLPTTASTT